MLRIGVLDDYQGIADQMADWSEIQRDADISFFRDHVTGWEVVSRLTGFDAVVLMRERTPLPSSVLSQLPQLRLIVTTGPANASVDVIAARRLGIEVVGTEIGAGMASTLEHTWALILALARQIPSEDANIRDGRWQQHIGTTVRGKTLGIVGLGRIGSQMPRIATAFGMSALAWSRNLTPEVAESAGARYVDRRELFTTSDVISLHVKLSDRSRGYVGPGDLERMRPDAFLVNTSRAEVVDQSALARVLHERRIGGAALDVFETEPLPQEHPLVSAPNTVLSPHVGYVTRETYRTFYQQAVESLAAFFLRGEVVRPVE